MVQTYQSPVRIYKHPFELVMAAYHKRFPTCPQIPIFVGSEITYDWKAEDGGEEIVERNCQLNVDAPYLVKKIAGVDYVYFKQRNHLDMRARTLLIEASNITFSSRIVVIENCRYYVHTENPDWTCFEQSASLDVKSFFGFETAVEKLAVKQYSANIAKGKEILEFFIDDLIKTGVTFVPRWKPPALDGTVGDKVGPETVEKVPEPSIMVEANGGTKLAGADLEKAAMDRSLPSTPPASSSGFCSSTTTANDITLPPLSGTAEEKLSMEELMRRRSSGGRRQSVSGANAAAKARAAEAAARTKSFDDIESKLESEYIQRFLGQLTPLEESRLCELKYGLQAAHKGKIPNDAHLLRFLRARDFDVQKATQMVINSLLWRKQHNVDKILQEFVPPPNLLKYFPGGWHHSDLHGRPMFIMRLGQMDIKGLLRSIGLEAVVKFTLSICEQGLVKAAEATKKHGKPISAMTFLVDLEGLSMRHLWRPGVQCLLRIIETLEAHYPECLGLVLITRAPRVFPILWTLISPFIDENTRKKFEMYASDQVLQELQRYVFKDYLPDFLGGPCKFEALASEAGPPWLVPKKEYLPIPGEELKREDILTSIYTSATVHRGTPYEVYVRVRQKGAVLTWDFDILKGECEFTILHSDKKIEPKQWAGQASSGVQGGASQSASAAHQTAGGGGTQSVVPKGPVDKLVDTVANEFSSLLSSNPPAPHYQVILAEPDYKIGVELKVAERAVLFGEADSMQGSHYCAQPGTYILQWRHPADHHDGSQQQDSSSATATAAADREGQGAVQAKTSTAGASGGGGATTGGTAHKCRLMVYHELLDSANFRGSVASLESCRSSFNSLAAAESLPSNQNSPNAQKRKAHVHLTTASAAVGQQLPTASVQPGKVGNKKQSEEEPAEDDSNATEKTLNAADEPTAKTTDKGKK